MNLPALAFLRTLLSQHGSLVVRFAITSLGRTGLVILTVILIRDFLFTIVGDPAGSPIGQDLGLWLVAGLLVIAYVGSALLQYDNQVTQQRMVKAVELDLLSRLLPHLLTLSLRFFEQARRGDLLQALRQDVVALRFVVLSYATLAMEGAVALGLAATAVWLSPTLALWVLFILPLATLPIVMIARRVQSRSYVERHKGAAVFDLLLQMIQGIRIIKAYQAERREADAALQVAESFLDEQVNIVRIRELSRVILESLGGLSLAAVIIAGGFQVMAGALAWPDLLAFLMAVRAMHGPLDHINVSVMQIQRHGASTERIEHLLAERPDIEDRAGAQHLPQPLGTISLDDVAFAYGEQPVLGRLSLSVHAGETIGIAGPSGSGKTTLLSLIARFYDPTSGSLRIAGIDMRDIRLADVHAAIAIVTQQPFLFDASVADNIRCGRPDATDAEILQAARSAGIHDEILALPRGYDTQLGFGAQQVSLGQAQRINIARAIIKDAPLLLLDEATSSLDAVAEVSVQRALERLANDRTTFVTAHRLATIRDADRIVVLDGGRQVAIGAHDDLMQSCDLYRRMWLAQQREDASVDVPVKDPVG